MTFENLKTKYGRNYVLEMGNFDFLYRDLTFDILVDFSDWKMVAFDDGNDKIVIFFQGEEF